MPVLKVDEKWSIEYSTQNDRPISWRRYGDFHSLFDENNATTALFYALLEARENPNK